MDARKTMAGKPKGGDACPVYQRCGSQAARAALLLRPSSCQEALQRTPRDAGKSRFMPPVAFRSDASAKDANDSGFELSVARLVEAILSSQDLLGPGMRYQTLEWLNSSPKDCGFPLVTEAPMAPVCAGTKSEG